MPLRLPRSIRSLAGAPTAAVVAVASLAVGISATTIIFSVVNAVMLRPLPVRAPAQLARVGSTRNGGGFYAFSYPDYTLLRDSTRAFSGLIAHQPIQVSWRQEGQAELGWAEIVSGNYFDVLGVGMTHGRGFLPEEDREPGRHPVVVISHRLWQQRFGAAVSAAGSTIRVNGHAFTIVGVAPRSFSGTFTGFAIDMWVPLMSQPLTMPDTRDRIDRRSAAFLMLTGRLSPGATVASARAELAPLAAELERLEPQEHRGIGIAVAPASGVHPAIQNLLPGFLALLFGAAGLVLLIACANVAGLLVAHALDRRRELAIRGALGASRARILLLLLAESLFLAAGGAIAAVLLTLWVASLLRAWQPPTGIPVAIPIAVDHRVLAFAALIALLTTVVAGLLPAWQGSRVDLIGVMKSRSAAFTGRGRLRKALIAVQVALALLLLSCAALIQRGTHAAAGINTGFDPTDVLVLSFEPRLAGISEAATRDFHRQTIDRLSAIPGVHAATLALFVPLGDRGDQLQVTTEPGAQPRRIGYNAVDHRYFDVLRIQMVRGRTFSITDDAGAPPAVIVTESMAIRAWPSGDPLGRQINIAGEPWPRTVVGVVRDGHYDSLADRKRPFMFLPYAQFFRPDMVLHVRADPRAAGVTAAIRREIAALDPDVPASDVRPMTAATAWALVPGRVAGTLLSIAAMLALLLAAAGIYGMISHAALRQAREVGIRLALGATPAQVVALAMRTGLFPVLFGALAGLGAAVLAGRALSALLYGLSPLDPMSFAAAAFTLASAAMLASYLPARRAAGTDPASALRAE